MWGDCLGCLALSASQSADGRAEPEFCRIYLLVEDRRCARSASRRRSSSPRTRGSAARVAPRRALQLHPARTPQDNARARLFVLHPRYIPLLFSGSQNPFSTRLRHATAFTVAGRGRVAGPRSPLSGGRADRSVPGHALARPLALPLVRRRCLPWHTLRPGPARSSRGTSWPEIVPPSVRDRN